MSGLAGRAARSLLVAFVALVVLAANAHAGGPVVLAGHDPDDHGFVIEYVQLFDEMLANVTNGGSGILSTGADPGSDAGNWIQSVASQMTPPQTVTFSNNSSISTRSFSGFAIIEMPSTTVDVSGGINASTEEPLLIDRAVDVAAFINGGAACSA
jgi:hypothetical protein